MLVLALLALSLPADTVRYEVSFPNAAHHEAQVTLTVATDGRKPVVVRMSRSSPGRYAMHEFAKNVYSVSAVDGRGRVLPVTTTDPYSWHIPAPAGVIRMTYTVFADRAGGTYTGIDRTHAHMNMPATFAWAEGHEQEPITIAFTVPAGSNWRAATQLMPTRDPMRFTAPDMQYFMDSPTELSDHMVRSWTVAGPGGRVDTLRIAMHHTGTDAELDAYTEMAKKVVAEQVAIFGETAQYDNGTYTFIADYLPWASGDGMEHRNSTIIASTGSLARSASGLIGTLSHEFFHSWNMERIRSAMIEPFDFTTADPSDALWFGEGFTQYYGGLVLHRAGLVDENRYIGTAGGIANAVATTTARRYGSPIDMSLHAPFVDAATAIDPTNFGNTFLSYYTYGAGIALGLDLTIRGRYPGKDLDGFMRMMWQRFGAGQHHAVSHPYTIDDIQQTLGAYVGDPAFAKDFFARYVHGREAPDYATLLAQAGIVLAQANPDDAVLGRVRTFGEDGATIESGTEVGTPLYEAGVDRGDVVHSIDGKPVTSAAEWRALESSHKPGDTVPITFTSRGQEIRGTITFGTDPRLTARPIEAEGGTLTPAQRAFRAAWLSSRAR